MADKKHMLTYAGLKQYEDELQNLKVTRRKEVTQKIKEVREQGDLSKNAEHGAAKDEQRDIELRIEGLEKLLKNTEAVIKDEIDPDKINISCKVKLLDVEYDEEMEFYIVSFTEASSLRDKISNGSSAGHVLTDKVMRDCVDVETQAGNTQYRILKIQRVSQRTWFRNRRIQRSMRRGRAAED